MLVLAVKKLKLPCGLINLSLSDIDAIIITHEHIDHTKSLSLISKKYNIPIYTNLKTWEAINKSQSFIYKNNYFFENEKFFKIRQSGNLSFSYST